jgi:hypothetical protein
MSPPVVICAVIFFATAEFVLTSYVVEASVALEPAPPALTDIGAGSPETVTVFTSVTLNVTVCVAVWADAVAAAPNTSASVHAHWTSFM